LADGAGDQIVLPSGYPHGASDDQILQALADIAGVIARSGADINVVLRFSPLVSAGQNELQSRFAQRSSDQQREALTALHEAIEVFRSSSDRASRTLIYLTWVLVGLTVALVVATVLLLLFGG
jgi:hypothetical protein